MAFDKKQLVHVTQNMDFSEWVYDTADTVATVIAAGYITSGEASCFGLKVGDTVRIRRWSDVTTKATLTSETRHKVTVVGASTTALDGGVSLIVDPSGTMGYGTGAGGAVTQATSKSTGVTLSKPVGAITMHNANLATLTLVSFTLTNTLIAAGDLLVLNHSSGGTAGVYHLQAQCGAGSAVISVTNLTAGTLGEAIVISFALIKGVVA